MSVPLALFQSTSHRDVTRNALRAITLRLPRPGVSGGTVAGRWRAGEPLLGG